MLPMAYSGYNQKLLYRKEIINMDNFDIVPSFMSSIFDDALNVSLDIAELCIDSIITTTSSCKNL